MSQISGTWRKYASQEKTEMHIEAWAVIHAPTNAVRSIWDSKLEAEFMATTGHPADNVVVRMAGKYGWAI